jgi:4a-hydroxytetrahydrobiopterin dehydratase
MTPTDAVLSEGQLASRLRADLPHWYLERGMLCRRWRTGGWKATLMVVNTIGHLAEAAWHHPDLSVSYASVTVQLTTHSAGGITEKDLALARKIEEVVGWQPGREPGSPLEGTPPDDPSSRYIQYDAAASDADA